MRTPYSGTDTHSPAPCSANGICGTTAELAGPPLVPVLFKDESGFTLSTCVQTFSLLSHVVSVNSSHPRRELGADGGQTNSGNITASNFAGRGNNSMFYHNRFIHLSSTATTFVLLSSKYITCSMSVFPDNSYRFTRTEPKCRTVFCVNKA